MFLAFYGVCEKAKGNKAGEEKEKTHTVIYPHLLRWLPYKEWVEMKEGKESLCHSTDDD